MEVDKQRNKVAAGINDGSVAVYGAQLRDPFVAVGAFWHNVRFDKIVFCFCNVFLLYAAIVRQQSCKLAVFV